MRIFLDTMLLFLTAQSELRLLFLFLFLPLFCKKETSRRSNDAQIMLSANAVTFNLAEDVEESGEERSTVEGVEGQPH